MVQILTTLRAQGQIQGDIRGLQHPYEPNAIESQCLQQFPIFSPQILLFLNSPNMYREAENSLSLRVPHFYF